MTVRFRFRPRYGALAWGTVGLGVIAAVVGAAGAATPLTIAGTIGFVLGVLYLGSPAWRYVVRIDDEALEVVRGDERKFRLPWTAVVRVIASPATSTCFVDGGEPERSLLVPGDGAPAPYDIERKLDLYRAIMARVPADKIREVTSLDAP